MGKKELLDTVNKLILDRASPIIIIGKDQTRKNRIAEFILNKFLPSDSSNLLRHLSGRLIKEEDLSMISQDLNSLSLFSKENYWFIKDFDEIASKTLSKFSDIIKQSADNNKIIITVSTLAASNSLRKQVEKNGGCIILEELKGSELKAWIAKELQKNNITKFSANLPDKLVEKFKSNIDEISKACTVLGLYSQNSECSIKDFESIYPSELSTNEFELIDKINEDTHQAENLLDTLLNDGSNPFAILGLLQKNFSATYEISLLTSQGKSLAEIETILQVPNWLLKKRMNVLRKNDRKSLKNKLEHILAADLSLKSKNLGNHIVLSRLIGQLS